MRVTGLIFVRTGLYLSLGVVFGMLSFMRTNAYKRRTGASPWHIHPLVWGGVSVCVACLVTLASTVFVAVFGTVLSVVACSPRSQASRRRDATEALGYRAVPGPATAPEQGSVSQSAQLAPPRAAFTAWLADPTGRNELRYFDGSGWTEHVSNAGVISVDRY
jgi:hypothetical protein